MGIEDIAKASFWDSKIDNIVVRYFLTRGLYNWRSGIEVLASSYGSVYYSSDVKAYGSSLRVVCPEISSITVRNYPFGTVMELIDPF